MRLINADALKTEVKNMVLRREGFHENDYEYGRNQALDYVADILIDDAPTIDAVPVVRCKDCKWFNDRITCPLNTREKTEGRGFCNRGERRREDGEA